MKTLRFTPWIPVLALLVAGCGGSEVAGIASGPLAPTITQVVPNSAGEAGGRQITIKGSLFYVTVGRTSVEVGGHLAGQVDVISRDELTCVVPGGTPGIADIKVITPDGEFTLPAGFTYHPAPTVTSMTPTVGIFLGGTNVTIEGTGFVANDAGPNTVRFGATVAAGIVTQSDTVITCRTPRGAGLVGVVVENANGSVAAGSFFYEGVPTLATVAPSAGTPLGGTTVSLTGTAFVDGGTQVTFGGAIATNVVVADSQHLTCSTPPGTPGNAAVGVTTEPTTPTPP
jgi:hypothetical protein